MGIAERATLTRGSKYNYQKNPYSRIISALGIAVNMVVAVAMVHSSFGFFMNWSGTQKGEGFEYHLMALAITTFLMIRGAGGFSLDRVIAATSHTAQPSLAHS